MNKLLFPVICVLCLMIAACGSEEGAGTTPSGHQNEKYVNDTFSFEIVYPADVLTGLGETPNGYGQTFESESKDARLMSYAIFNTKDVALNEAYERAQKGEVSDKQIDEKSGMFMVRGVNEGRAYIVKKYLLDDVYIVYDFTYPENKKDLYEPINKEMIESFKAF